jgi:hypothetical protein
MKFEPKPDNCFSEFIETYFERCRKVCPKLRGIGGKWTFEDLIPGLSDFDSRLLFTDDTTVPEWAEMSLAIGNVHTDLAKEFPQWARILEHLPGLNLMRKEMINPTFYYPEFQLWSFYCGDRNILDSIRNYLTAKPWTRRDEIFHLKKFALYYGPYQRGIDPAVNIGRWENKYPLHSRFMHYFTPPLQSAVSLVLKRGVAGKFEALRLARKTFPHPEVIDMILAATDRHYEIQEYYEEPKLSQIEKDLEKYLRTVYAALADHVTQIRIDPNDTPKELKAKVAAVPVDPAEQFYEGVKFSRFMKGRLLFYATSIAWFDTTWLIHIELGRIVNNFFDKPLTTFGQIIYKENLPAEEVLNRLGGKILSPEIVRQAREFARIAALPIRDGKEKQHAYQVAQIFEPVQSMVETLGEELQRRLPADG